MSDPKVVNNPRANEGAIDLSKSTISRHAVLLTAAALTLTASDKALAALEYSPTHSTEPSKVQFVPATTKPAFYQVKQGDSLSAIAKQYQISQQSIRAVNPGLDPDKLRVDQSLKLPAGLPNAHIVVRGENPSSIANRHHVSVKDLLNANPKLNPKNMMIGEAIAIHVMMR